jgi:hypothetical protein
LMAQASMHDIFVQVVTGRDSADAAHGGSHAN